jgi:hypothetical protein
MHLLRHPQWRRVGLLAPSITVPLRLIRSYCSMTISSSVPAMPGEFAHSSITADTSPVHNALRHSLQVYRNSRARSAGSPFRALRAPRSIGCTRSGTYLSGLLQPGAAHRLDAIRDGSRYLQPRRSTHLTRDEDRWQYLPREVHHHGGVSPSEYSKRCGKQTPGHRGVRIYYRCEPSTGIAGLHSRS